MRVHAPSRSLSSAFRACAAIGEELYLNDRRCATTSLRAEGIAPNIYMYTSNYATTL